MIERLSNVIYWFFSVIAAITTALAIFGDSMNTPDRIALIVLAVLIWAVGRAVRYVIQGV